MPLIVPNAITQICAYQKDEYYINSLKGNINNMFSYDIHI